MSTKNTTWTAPSASVRGPASDEYLAHARVAQVERQLVLGATEGELRQLDQEHHRRARYDAVCERVDAEEGRREDREEDLHAVVDKGSDGAREELPVRLQHARDERRQPHEDRD